MCKMLVTFSALVMTFGVAYSQEQARASESMSNSLPIMESLPDHLYYQYELESNGASSTFEQIFENWKLWEPGDTLKVCFFGGGNIVRALIANVSREWEKYANIKFDFGEAGVLRSCTSSSAGFSQIRVGFSEKGYWSAIGTDSIKNLTSNQPSMNFEGFSIRYSDGNRSTKGVLYTPDNVVGNSDIFDRGTILHEFGHALGVLHEHQNRNLKCYDEIKWVGDNNVYDIMGRYPNGWDKEKVDRNIGVIDKWDRGAVHGKPDPKSIMMYSLYPEILKSGTSSRCYSSQNNILSDGDKELVAQMYPRTAISVSASSPAAPSGRAINNDKSNDYAVASNISNSSVRKDYLDRIKSDLGSPITSIRRDARGQLASILTLSSSEEIVKNLLEEAQRQDYRFQLGLMVALSNAKMPFKLNKEYLKYFDAIRKSNSDRTLLKYENQARANSF